MDTFVAFANKVPFYGFSVVCLDHPVIQDMLPRLRRRVVTYGYSRQADYRAEALLFDGTSSTFTVLKGDVPQGEVSLEMPGRHNVQNALAALACGMELDIPFDVIARGLHGFGGVERRFTVCGEKGGVLVVDDYGHHPVEIDATLDAAAKGFAQRRIIAVFQPHRYSRLQDLFGDFCRSFHRADVVVVCPIYAAGEAPVDGLDHHRVAQGIRTHGHRSVEAVDSLEGAVSYLREQTQAGDVVITLGAGNVNEICGRLLEEGS